MSSTNPRRTTPVTRPDASKGNGLSLKTSLRKGATFHSPITPPSSPPAPSTFQVPSLPHRSQTTLDDVVDAHVRRAALNIDKFEETLAAIKAEPLTPTSPFSDDTLPIPRAFLDHTVVGGTMSEEPASVEPERRVLRPRNRRSSRNHESDSGLGTSVASTNQKRKETKTTRSGASAITRSVTASRSQNTQRLSGRAKNRITEHILRPLLDDRALKDFRPIVLDCPRRIQEDQIVCLRDLEKTLIFMAPERAKSVELYRDFCLTSIRCIQATVEYLSDREQTRPHDRPYNNGYFIDLVEQIRQHAQQMQEARTRQDAGEELDEMDVHPTDEIKLMGGLTTNGRPAELVRVKKNGKAISIATGKPVEDLEEDIKSPIRFKRSMSEQAEDEEEIMRSMARRKKNASPEELAPKKCNHPGCNKEFKRPCDLTKHEKTHSRPWKCPIPTCKYHDYGWPTEKEMDRHVNDKHSDAPPMYECHFKPCPYKSKRESNCKQHMEKAHGWTYVRTKTNGQKKSSSKAGSSAQPTPMIKGLPTPNSEQNDVVMTPPDDSLFDRYNELDFPTYPSDQEFNASLFDQQPFDRDLQLDYSPIDNSTPSTDSGQFNTYEDLSPEFTGQFDDIYGAHVQIPTPPSLSIYNKDVSTFANFAAEMCRNVPMQHMSTIGQGNQIMLTPPTMVDEGFEDFQPACANQFGQDFPLFPSNTMDKTPEFGNNLFATIPPSLAAGYSQPSSQDFNMDYNASMDWTASDFQGFPN
ncbi:hypothetical protein F4821DRAFT_252836 [Hypoxylon rubiginosum]|uniref:Uncharacterized protein n=1 Tax=Hypoxylon rubiginosum TaxID=110542 RepID=A0ACC0DMX7_9PEZI|nr:hypothetical protein F4821DRAFT_252836 [Hypoxylon rubiginosum]